MIKVVLVYGLFVLSILGIVYGIPSMREQMSRAALGKLAFALGLGFFLTVVTYFLETGGGL